MSSSFQPTRRNLLFQGAGAVAAAALPNLLPTRARAASGTVCGVPSAAAQTGPAAPANMGCISAWGASNIFHWRGQLAELGARFRVSTYQGGNNSDSGRWMAARMGAIPIPITISGGSVPGTDGATVPFTSTADYAHGSLIWQTTTHAPPLTGWLNGIYGSIFETRSQGGPWTFNFRRIGSGSAASIPDGSPFVPEAGVIHRHDVTIIGMGNNDAIVNLHTKDPDYSIRTLDACFDYVSTFCERILVHNHYNLFHPDSRAWHPWVNAMNAHIKQRYANLMIDTFGLITDPGIWNQPPVLAAHIAPTPTDKAAQAAGLLPPSLSDDGGAHWGKAANEVLLAATIDKMVSLGWYS